MADLGGAHPACAPLLLRPFCTIAPPPLFVHGPLLKPKKKKKKKKKKCVGYPPPTPFGTCAWSECRSPPRPPPPRLSAFLGLARLSTLVALRKKSVGVPPPPPLISFFGTCATLDASGAPNKKCRSPPLPPPPLSAFLGLARLSTLVALRKKNSVVPPPPFFFSWIRPCHQ